MHPIGKFYLPALCIPFWLNQLCLKSASHTAVCSPSTPSEQNYLAPKCGGKYLTFLSLCLIKVTPEMPTGSSWVYVLMICWDHSTIPLFIHRVSQQRAVNLLLCSEQDSMWWRWTVSSSWSHSWLSSCDEKRWYGGTSAPVMIFVGSDTRTLSTQWSGGGGESRVPSRELSWCLSSKAWRGLSLRGSESSPWLKDHGRCKESGSRWWRWSQGLDKWESWFAWGSGGVLKVWFFLALDGIRFMFQAERWGYSLGNEWMSQHLAVISRKNFIHFLSSLFLWSFTPPSPSKVGIFLHRMVILRPDLIMGSSSPEVRLQAACSKWFWAGMFQIGSCRAPHSYLYSQTQCLRWMWKGCEMNIVALDLKILSSPKIPWP